MTENALACRWASGRIPFGYTIDADKHLHPDPALVPIVQEAFEMYAAGVNSRYRKKNQQLSCRHWYG